MIINCLY